MSKNFGLSVQEVRSAIKQMLKDKYFLSSVCYNSLYFYTHDKVPVAVLSEYTDFDKKANTESFLKVSNIPDISAVNIHPDFYKDLCVTLGGYFYDLQNNVKPQKNVNISDAINFFEQKKHFGEQEAVVFLLKYLIENKCPINIINRTYYLFNATKKKPNPILANEKNKLVMYDTANGQQWFFMGDAGTRTFSALNNTAQKIFDNVDKAYQKQRV